VIPAAAPKLVSAKLADSLGSIDVLFDRATDQVGSCSLTPGCCRVDCGLDSLEA